MYCPNCASRIHNNEKFCTRCGLNLTLEASQSEEITRLLEKCHNGYSSTVIGLGLVILALLITIAAIMFGVIPAAIGSLVFVAWAIPAIAQGVGKWLSAKSEIRSILEVRSVGNSEVQPRKRLPSEGAKTDSWRFGGGVTEETTANLTRTPAP